MLLAMAAGPAAAVSVTDDGGAVVRLAAPAQRVVALAPSLTELVFAAGGGDRLVAVSRYSDYPPQAANLPRVGDAFSVNLERLVALQPDLVLSWQSGNDPRVRERLQSMGIPVFVLEPRVLADIPAALQRLGRLLGTTETARAEARKFTRAVEEIRRRYADRLELRVFYQVSREPLITLNGRHMVTSVLELCRGVNVFGGLAPVAPHVNREQVLARDPQVILVGGARAKASQAREDWSRFHSIAAVRAGAVYAVDSDLLNRQTPRLVQGARQVCERLERARDKL